MRKLIPILCLGLLVGGCYSSDDDHSSSETPTGNECPSGTDCDPGYMGVDVDADPVAGSEHDVSLDAFTSDGTGPYDYSIDWGDGSKDDLIDAVYILSDIDHTYAASGTYNGKVTSTERSDNRETGVGGFVVKPGS